MATDDDDDDFGGDAAAQVSLIKGWLDAFIQAEKFMLIAFSISFGRVLKSTIPKLKITLYKFTKSLEH